MLNLKVRVGRLVSIGLLDDLICEIWVVRLDLKNLADILFHHLGCVVFFSNDCDNWHFNTRKLERIYFEAVRGEESKRTSRICRHVIVCEQFVVFLAWIGRILEEVVELGRFCIELIHACKPVFLRRVVEEGWGDWRAHFY